MTMLLKRSFILTLTALSLATLALTVWSYRQNTNWDLSRDGMNWRYILARPGSIIFAFVNGDAPPRLGSSAAPTPYNSAAASYSYETNFLHQSLSASVSKSVDHAEAVTGHPQPQMRQDHMRKVREFTIGRLAKARAGCMEQLDKETHSRAFAGFFIRAETSPNELVLRIPLPALALLFGLLPTLSLVSYLRLRARRKHQNLCLSCGYNLTANITGICPECGTPVKKTSAPASPAQRAEIQ